MNERTWRKLVISTISVGNLCEQVMGPSDMKSGLCKNVIHCSFASMSENLFQYQAYNLTQNNFKNKIRNVRKPISLKIKKG